MKNKIKIIIHCSASGFGNASLITKWHTLERKWDTIGYHFVILNGYLSSIHFNSFFDGHIESGRPLDDNNKISKNEKGAHAYGFNSNSIGVCLIGNSNQFTTKQMNSLYKLCDHLLTQFPNSTVIQHSDINPDKPNCAGLNPNILNDIMLLHNLKHSHLFYN